MHSWPVQWTIRDAEMTGISHYLVGYAFGLPAKSLVGKAYEHGVKAIYGGIPINSTLDVHNDRLELRTKSELLRSLFVKCEEARAVIPTRDIREISATPSVFGIARSLVILPRIIVVTDKGEFQFLASWRTNHVAKTLRRIVFGN